MKTETIKENGFKETEIGLIPSDWDIVNLGNKEYFEVLNSGIDKFENSKGYLSTSSIRWNKIIDVECDITYNDRPSRANMQPRLDTVWFAKMKNTVKVYDFTKENQIEVEKYILSTGFTGFLCNRSKAYPKYLGKIFLSPWFNQIKDNLAHGSTQKAVNNQDIKKILIPLPSLLEQQRITLVLSKVQRAIEQQDKIIQITKEMKKSLMNKLFTKGLHGEEQKETEIGLMPKSWQAESIISVVEKTKTTDPTRKPNLSFKYIDVSGVSNESFKISEYKTYTGLDAPGRARKLIQTHDVIFATVRPTLKRIAYIEESFNGEICSTAFCVLRSKKDILSSKYLYYCIQRDEFIEELAKLQRGASYPAITDSDVKRQKILFPKIEEQKEIANILSNIDKKLSQAESRKQTLQSLFKTMLNQLMTGRVRVKNLDILDIEVN